MAEPPAVVAQLTSPSLGSLGERDQELIARLHGILNAVDPLVKGGMQIFPTWVRFAWKMGGVAFSTLVQLREVSPQVTSLEVDFPKKQIKMHFTKHGVPLPSVKPPNRRKRSRPREFDSDVDNAKDALLLKQLFALVCEELHCRPKHSVDIQKHTYEMKLCVREKRSLRAFERIWKRYHAHLLSMKFDLERGNLVLTINKLS
jgi:hypothetical protein